MLSRLFEIVPVFLLDLVKARDHRKNGTNDTDETKRADGKSSSSSGICAHSISDNPTKEKPGRDHFQQWYFGV